MVTCQTGGRRRGDMEIKAAIKTWCQEYELYVLYTTTWSFKIGKHTDKWLTFTNLIVDSNKRGHLL